MELNDILSYETEDLLNLNEAICEEQPIKNYWSVESELVEAKERINKLEKIITDLGKKVKQMEKNSKTNKYSIIPIISNNEHNFCDINSSSLLINVKTNMFFDNVCCFSFNQLNLYDHNKETNKAVDFLQQFKNIKSLIIDFNTIFYHSTVTPDIYESNIFNGDCFSGKRNCEQFINTLNVIMNSNNIEEITYKTTYLYNNSKPLFDELIKQKSYKKVNIDIKNCFNIVNGQPSGYASAPCINEFYNHCKKNKIIFTSNIGLNYEK